MGEGGLDRSSKRMGLGTRKTGLMANFSSSEASSGCLLNGRDILGLSIFNASRDLSIGNAVPLLAPGAWVCKPSWVVACLAKSVSQSNPTMGMFHSAAFLHLIPCRDGHRRWVHCAEKVVESVIPREPAVQLHQLGRNSLTQQAEQPRHPSTLRRVETRNCDI